MSETPLAPLKQPTPRQDLETWFEQIAQSLLNKMGLRIADEVYRIREVECYYRSEDHPDPFPHSSTLQETTGRWYFHREGDEYRGGSYKGLDVTFGPRGVIGAALIRTLEAPDGAQINGCSLCVDHMLAKTGFATVAALDEALGARLAWEPGGPLQLVEHDWPHIEPLATARVGLTLKRMALYKHMPEFLMKPYRFLTDLHIKKGKLHTIMALHKRGDDAQRIQQLTGVKPSALKRYIEAYERGLEAKDFNSYRGHSWTVEELCSIHGTWEALYGSARSAAPTPPTQRGEREE